MANLPTQQLGNTGLEVTRLSYGSMELRNDSRGRFVGEKQAEQVLNQVLDLGINLIDTSIDYGRSEERIGRYISQRRSEYFLATKCGCPLQRDESITDYFRTYARRLLQRPGTPKWVRQRAPAPPANNARLHHFEPEHITAGLEQSLRRMKTDYVDILQVHHPPPLDELVKCGGLDWLQELKRDGKVRFIGVSGGLPVIEEYIAHGGFDVVQVAYSLFRDRDEAAIAEASEQRIGTLVRAGASSGGGLPRNQRVRRVWTRPRMKRIAAEMDPVEFNLRFTLGRPGVDTVLAGTANAAHLEANVAAIAKGPLPEELVETALKTVAPRSVS